jgi:hypothetical protein
MLVLFLCGLSLLITVAVLVMFAFSDRIAALLPHTTAFVVVFTCGGVALGLWLHLWGKRLRSEEQPRGESNAHFASSPRTKRHHRRRHPRG